MNSELQDACIAAVQQAEGPLTASQIGAAARGGKKPGAKFTREVAEALSQLPDESGIREWPRHGRSRIFAKTSFREGLENAFLKALDAEPLTVPKAAKPVSKLLQRVSESHALAELKTAAPQLASARRVLQVAMNRQSVVYLSFDYLQRLIPARGPESSIADSILAVVERLQSGPGNYVRIDHLRNTLEMRKPVDDAAIELAEKGRLVLGRYDGPRPVPEEDKWNYIEDRRGELFIGLALPRTG